MSLPENYQPHLHKGFRPEKGCIFAEERCRSGRTGLTRNQVFRDERNRGFESPPLRPLKSHAGTEHSTQPSDLEASALSVYGARLSP